MPLSVFQGAPLPREGEPLYTQEDHDWFIALQQERRDTCPSCGLLKVTCRDKANQFGVFEIAEEQCHATKALANHREKTKNRSRADQEAIQASVKFAEGKAPPLEIGLDLADGSGDEDDDSQDDESDEESH